MREPRVVVASGHMVDAPDRSLPPRFPPDQVPRVTDAVRDVLADWRVGGGTTLITQGARGTDIIAAEAARSRGAAIRLVLPLPPDEFERRSVVLPGSDWTARFRTLMRAAQVEVLTRPAGNVFERANERIIELARGVDPRPYAVIVWNGQEGDAPGGTRDFVARLGLAMDDERLRVIDPTPVRASVRDGRPT